MPRKVASVDEALDQDKVETPEVAPDSPAEATPVKEWRFVKNIHPHEVIIFTDKSQFKFERSLLVTSDESLAKKILSVAQNYNIVLQD